MRIAQIIRDEVSTDELHRLQLVRVLGDEHAGRDARPLVDVEEHDPPTHRIEVGLDKEEVLGIVDEPIARLEAVDQLHHRGAHFGVPGIVQVHEVQPVLRARPLTDRNDEELPVVAHLSAHIPLRPIRTLPDQDIVRLWRAERVVVELLSLAYREH